MTAEQIVASVFPFLAEDRERDRIEAEKRVWVNAMREMISEYGLDVKKVSAAASRPEFLTREEAIELLTRKEPRTP